jgi:hypothetical protein
VLGADVATNEEAPASARNTPGAPPRLLESLDVQTLSSRPSPVHASRPEPTVAELLESSGRVLADARAFLARAAAAWPVTEETDGYAWELTPEGEDVAPFTSADADEVASDHSDDEGLTEREAARFSLARFTDSALGALLDAMALASGEMDLYCGGMLPL